MLLYESNENMPSHALLVFDARCARWSKMRSEAISDHLALDASARDSRKTFIAASAHEGNTNGTWSRESARRRSDREEGEGGRGVRTLSRENFVGQAAGRRTRAWR